MGILIAVERDGQTRNALVVDYINRFYGNKKTLLQTKATDCMWLISQECQKDSYDGEINNDCGVPHSSMSRKDNMGFGPLWWEDTYHEGLIGWMNAKENADATFGDNFRVKTKWDLSRRQCVYFDLVDPPKVLIAEIPKLLKIGFQIVWDDITKEVENNLLDGITELTGIPRGVLELSKNKLRTVSNKRMLAENDNDNDEVVEFQMLLDKGSSVIFNLLLKHNNVAKIGNYTVKYAKLDGEEYNVTDSGSNNVVIIKKDDESDGLDWSVYAFIVLLVINVIGIVLMIIYCKKQNNRDTDDVYNKL